MLALQSELKFMTRDLPLKNVCGHTDSLKMQPIKIVIAVSKFFFVVFDLFLYF